MELLPTIPTHVGMVLGGGAPTLRPVQWETIPPNSCWTMEELGLKYDTFDTTDKVPINQGDRDGGHRRRWSKPDPGKRFPTYYNWGDVSNILSRAYALRRFPFTSFSPSNPSRWRVAHNLVYISEPLESLNVLKILLINKRRIDVEQAVGLVLRSLPEHAAELIKLVPSMMTQSCMWYTKMAQSDPTTDTLRRQHLSDMLRRAAGQTQLELGSATWPEIAQVLFRVRRKRPADFTRGLRLPDWLVEYYSGENKELLAWDSASRTSYPGSQIDNPLVVSKRNFMRISRYVWRLLPSAPGKVLRRTIQSLEKTMVYADDKKSVIEQTTDKASLGYTFVAAQRRLQLRVVSDLKGMFLKQGEGSRMQQNTDDETTLEERLGEIALSGEKIDWAVLTAIRRPKGVDGENLVEELIEQVDRVCECLEQYVVIYGDRHTERLRPMSGRRRGFRGPVDDWNAAVDVLWELQTRIREAGYAVVDEGVDEEKDEFTVLGTAGGAEETDQLGLPRGHKFLAQDIMAWNSSWGDDALALARMPPDWWTWLEKRRGEGKCPEAKTRIIID